MNKVWENEKIAKHAFIKAYLEPLYKALNSNIGYLEYEVNEETKDEYLVICYMWGDGFGHYQAFRKRICITCDSLSAIVHDSVMKV